MRGNPGTHQESAEDLIFYIPPTPTFAPSDRQASDKHASSMAGGPTSASEIDLRRGSTHADLRCHPDPAPADPDESPVEIHMTPPSTPVSVIRRSNPIVLIRLPYDFREEQAQALDYRQSCDLIEYAHQIPVVDDDSTLRCLRWRQLRGQPLLHRSRKDASRKSLFPSLAPTDRHTRAEVSKSLELAQANVGSSTLQAVETVWSNQQDRRLLQLRNENELPWKRIAGAYFSGADPAWLRRRYAALTTDNPAQSGYGPTVGLRKSRRIGSRHIAASMTVHPAGA
ncbi:hypothetical protein LTR74_018483 [Friedmanniomyces endolithicus]|nr:hypothetical protein LTR74_018483 [Friedmanniomyces endolithicus]